MGFMDVLQTIEDARKIRHYGSNWREKEATLRDLEGIRMAVEQKGLENEEKRTALLNAQIAAAELATSVQKLTAGRELAALQEVGANYTGLTPGAPQGPPTPEAEQYFYEGPKLPKSLGLTPEEEQTVIASGRAQGRRAREREDEESTLKWKQEGRLEKSAADEHKERMASIEATQEYRSGMLQDREAYNRARLEERLSPIEPVPEWRVKDLAATMMQREEPELYSRWERYSMTTQGDAMLRPWKEKAYAQLEGKRGRQHARRRENVERALGGQTISREQLAQQAADAGITMEEALEEAERMGLQVTDR